MNEVDIFWGSFAILAFAAGVGLALTRVDESDLKRESSDDLLSPLYRRKWMRPVVILVCFGLCLLGLVKAFPWFR